MWRGLLRFEWSFGNQTPLVGIAIGVGLGLAVQSLSPHVGEGCGTLGQITEEWEIGATPRPLMCIATVDGNLVYDRFVPPKKPRRPEAIL
jgi:hypothetical protein